MESHEIPGRPDADAGALLALARILAEALAEEARAETHTCPSLSPCPACARTESALAAARLAGLLTPLNCKMVEASHPTIPPNKPPDPVPTDPSRHTDAGASAPAPTSLSDDEEPAEAGA